MRRSPRLPPALEGLYDDHVPAAAWAWRTLIDRIIGTVLLGFGRDVEQLAGQRERGFARGAGEQAVVAYAVEAAGQDVKQEPADKLVGPQRHDALVLRPVATIVLVAERDPARVERNQPPVEMATRWV
jgi:hypothetical protein